MAQLIPKSAINANDVFKYVNIVTECIVIARMWILQMQVKESKAGKEKQMPTSEIYLNENQGTQNSQ